jgi:hypothetical protein
VQLSSQGFPLQGPLFALAQMAKSGGLRFHSERLFQIIPIQMKRAISVRKATLTMATVRNTSVGDKRGSCPASRPAKPQAKLSETGNVSVPDADGARCGGDWSVDRMRALSPTIV